MKKFCGLLALEICLCLLFGPLMSHAATEPSPQTAVQDFRGVAKKAIPAVVSIKVKLSHQNKDFDDEDPFGFFGDQDDLMQRFFFGTPRRSQPPQHSLGQASGFVVSPDGYIVTNAHVVSDAGEITVKFNDGVEHAGKVVGFDENTDVAVIKIEANQLPYLNLGNSDDLEVGQWVVAIGNPLGLQASLTVGVVSAKGRNDLDIVRIEDFIQTDAAINRGNSGGPLLDLNGHVIGINTAIVSNSSSGGYMGIGFAIPSNMAQHIMDQLITKGSVSRGFMGVAMQALDANLAASFGLDKTEGALIAEVVKESPADQAGLKQGDVIVRFNNQPVTNIACLRNAIAMMTPGTKLQLTVLRNSKKIELPLEIGAFPSEKVLASQHVNLMGIEVDNLSKELAQNLGYVNDTGVIITKVEPGSPAAWAGLKKGALITSINQQKVASVGDFKDQIEKTEKGKPVLFLLKQGDLLRYVSIKES